MIFWSDITCEHVGSVRSQGPWCSSYHYCTTSFNNAWTQVLRRFKSCSRCVGDLQWWESLKVVPPKKSLMHLSVNHSAKTIHHHRHHHFHQGRFNFGCYWFFFFWLTVIFLKTRLCRPYSPWWSRSKQGQIWRISLKLNAHAVALEIALLVICAIQRLVVKPSVEKLVFMVLLWVRFLRRLAVEPNIWCPR